MKREWKPGDVAMVTGYLGGKYVAIRTRDGWNAGVTFLPDGDAQRARPLVVIDPEDREQVERLCAAMKANGWTGIDDEAPSDMRTVLRSLIAPPRPPEPTGLGAVVEDAEGRKWVRTDREQPAWSEWGNAIGRWSYPKIAAVRILSEGVDQ